MSRRNSANKLKTAEPAEPPEQPTATPSDRADTARPDDEQAYEALGVKNVHELQGLIEHAFVLLDNATEAEAVPVAPVVPKQPIDHPVMGPAAGSAVRAKPATIRRRMVKTLLAFVAATVIGVVPLEKLLTPASSEAFLNAPVYVLTAPVGGHIEGSTLVPGTTVERDEAIARIVPFGASAGGVPLVAPGDGKVWEVMVAPGDRVAAGQEVARLAACSAVSVTASVSEVVYDKLRPGTPARFNFYGEDRFYYGTVSNLFGHAIPTGDFAISPASMTRDAFRVMVTLPELADFPGCTIGRRGEVLFNPPGR